MQANAPGNGVSATISKPKRIKKRRDMPPGDYSVGEVSLGRRLLTLHQNRLLLVWNRDGEQSDIRLLDSNGIWTDKAQAWNGLTEAMLVDMASEVAAKAAEFTERALRDTLAAIQSARRSGHSAAKRLRIGCGTAYAMAPEKYRAVDCDYLELDADLRYIGCANGVVDLHTAKRLSPEEGRKKLISKSTGIDYLEDGPNPEAAEVVERLTRHVPPEEAEWIWQALGFALRGDPSSRFYALIGEAGGGKSTFLKRGVLGALGKDYAQAADPQIFTSVLAPHNDHLAAITLPRRIAVLDDFKPPRRISSGRVKDITAGADVWLSRKGEKGDTVPVTATLFLSGNPHRIPNFRLSGDTGMQRRYRLLNYPEIPEADRDKGLQRAVLEREVREAMLHKLVQYASTCPVPPEDTPLVSESQRDRAEAEAGDLGEFAARIVPGFGNLHVATAWEAWCELHGESALLNNAGGIAKRRFSAKLAELNPAIPQKRTRVSVGGKQQLGWSGMQLIGGES